MCHTAQTTVDLTPGTPVKIIQTVAFSVPKLSFALHLHGLFLQRIRQRICTSAEIFSHQFPNRIVQGST